MCNCLKFLEITPKNDSGAEVSAKGENEMTSFDETTSENLENHSVNDSKKLTRGTTVRLSPEADQVVRELSDEFKLPYAQIIRIAVEDRLASYLGTVRYIDTETAVTLNNNIAKLGNVMVEIKKELSAIGRNYNQEIRLMNEGYVRRHDGADWDNEDENRSSHSSVLDVDKVEKLVRQYQRSTDELGRQLWLTRQ